MYIIPQLNKQRQEPPLGSQASKPSQTGQTVKPQIPVGDPASQNKADSSSEMTLEVNLCLHTHVHTHAHNSPPHSDAHLLPNQPRPMDEHQFSETLSKVRWMSPNE